MHKQPYIQIIDTTLRDGEQTSGVSFAPHEKLIIARNLIEKVKVDKIEIASAKVSKDEFVAVKLICKWAKEHNYLDRIEVLGFINQYSSIDWIKSAGCSTVNLLCKGSYKHCKYQLNKTPSEHFKEIGENIIYALSKNMKVNLYLEDWSNGMKDSPEYVYNLIESISKYNVGRIMLADTLGILNPLSVIEYIRKLKRKFLEQSFDFHAHNDYDLAVSNVLAAVLSGVKGLHTTINGLGERAGNAPLASVQAILKDQFDAKTNIVESELNRASQLVASHSGISIPINQPIVGENVFTQVAGVHADGDHKKNLYCSKLQPERFDRNREYALGKNSGKANIKQNLEELDIEADEALTEEIAKRITELGEKKELVTQEDLPYIINDILNHKGKDEQITLENYFITCAKGLKPIATIKVNIHNKCYEQSANGDGQFDAFVTAIKFIYKNNLKKEFPILSNYAITIPPGGKTDALVQTVITWNYNGKIYKTRGLDADQTESAIKATMKMLNLIESD